MSQLDQTFPATFEEYESFHAAVDRFLIDEQIASKPAHTLSLSLEELVVNVIRHAGTETIPCTIHVRIDRTSHVLTMTVEDNGSPFDPTQAPDPAFEAAVEDRPVGGLGIHLVRNMVNELGYDRIDDRNRTWVKIELSQPDNSANPE